MGDVIDPETGQILAGARVPGEAGRFADTLTVLRSLAEKGSLSFGRRDNTVIGVVATNAKLTKEEINKVAQMAQNGVSRVVRPAHTMVDGDTIFALATGHRKADVTTVGAFAAEMVSQAILRAVKSARPAGGLPALSEG
jgi:L-aminopeptidase/D-esterase-like protein